MGIETKSKSIGGYEYTVNQLSAKEGRRVLVRLARVAGGAIAAAAAGKDKADAISALAAGLNDDDMDYLCDTLARTTRVRFPETGMSPLLSDIFDMHFAGKYLEMVQWLQFCLEVNYASFFAGALERGLLANASESKSPTKSTGASGAS